MAKSRGRGRKKPRQKGFYWLRLPNPEALRVADAKASDLRAFLAAYQAAMESQRIEHGDVLARSLLEACRPFDFTHWQRNVSSKYSLRPLSSRGSAIHGIGGRFNVGNIDPDRHPPFPALYLAVDQDTALQEALGDIQPKRGLTFRELALKRTDSYAMYSLSGSVESVLDVTRWDALKPFLEIIKSFRAPDEIALWAKRRGHPILRVVQSIEELEQSIMEPNWRRYVSALGIVTASQQFGREARAAGIEAIRYLSVKSHKPCLAVFPENLAHSDSYVELDDPTPEEYPDLIRRLDRKSWPRLI